jgi:MFS family permease
MRSLFLGYSKAFSLFRRDLRLLLVCTASMWLALGVYSVVFNLFLVRLGYDTSFIGLARAVGSLGFAGFGLVAGLVGQRFGSRTALLAGVGLAALAYGMMGAGELVPAHLRSPWLLVGNAMGWIGYATFFVNSGPLMMQSTTPTERNHAFSVSATLHPIMGFGGGLLGGLLPGVIGRVLGVTGEFSAPYGYTLFIAALITAAGLPALWLTRKVAVPQLRGAGERTVAAPVGIIGFLALFAFFRGAGEHAVHGFFNVYLDLELSVSTAQIGVLLAIGQLVAVPGAIAYPGLAERWGVFRTVVVSVVGISIALLPLVLIPHWVPAALGFAGVIALAAVLNTALTVYSQTVVSVGWRSVMSGVLSTANGLSIAVSSVGGGVMISTLGYRSFFGVSAALTLLSILVFWGYFRVPRGEFAHEAVEPGVTPVVAEAKAR